MQKRYFEDLIEGEKLDCNNIIFSRKDIINFAKQFDPQPFHTNEDAAEKSIFGGLIASSLHTLAACKIYELGIEVLQLVLLAPINL